MPSFNASQLEAIEARNPNILVSAAAGSGKTTVMVEKIRRTLLSDPEASISRFLVITFTRDAARNMKDKLRSLLEESVEAGSPAAARALGELETAVISTIHAFCSQLLREYNDNTGAAMNPRVLSEAEKKHMLDESFADAAERLLDPESGSAPADRQDVSALLAAFGPESARSMAERLYDALMGIPDPLGFLDRIIQDPPFALWEQEVLAAIRLDTLELEDLLRREEELMASPAALPAFADTAAADRDLAASFLDALGRTASAADMRALFSATKDAFVKAPSPRNLDEPAKDWKDRFNKLRNEMKGASGLLNTAIRRLDRLADPRNARLNAIIRRELRGLALLVKASADAYAEQKLSAGVIDYADMEQTAYRIMSDPEKKQELLARYQYIFVDECQDVSGIQDAVIKSLAGPGHQFFMVGDIKQSIYGFRHADPALFDQERRSYSDAVDAPERRIFFMDNYRSCRSVVDAVNAVFRDAMDRQVTDMDYLPGDLLRCNRPEDSGPVDVILVRRGDEDADPLEAQCEAAGRWIQSLITPAPEAGAAGFQYRDIVILLRAAQGRASAIADHLKKMHIPAVYEGVPDFFGLAEVKSFLALLTVIDNFHHDDALAGALIHPPFLFSEGDLADIRLEKPEHIPFYEAFAFCAARNEKPVDRKCRRAMDRLSSWREKSDEMPVPDFVWWLLRDTGIYAARGAYPDGKARQANLDALYQRAVDGQQAGQMRLSDLIASLREARETRRKDTDDRPVPGPADNYVRIMTMHKSKGLEFPAVILMDLQRSIRRKRSDETLRMNISSSGGALGFYLPAVQRGRNSRVDSQGLDAFDLRDRRKNIAEATRLLYVAMTRAERKLCLIGAVKDGEEALWRNHSRPSRIWKTRSMLDMVMPAVLQSLALPESGTSACNGLWRLSCVEGKAIAEDVPSPEAADPRLADFLSRPEPMTMYLPEAVEALPLKTSVTSLAHHAPVLGDDYSEETAASKRLPGDAPRTFRLSSAPSKPAFLEEEKASAADAGTATHRFLRLIRLSALQEAGDDPAPAVLAEADRMLREGILAPEESVLIRLKGVSDFFRSDLGRRMLRSGDIRREVPFSLRIRPDQPTMVQGIIDCVFREEDQWILIDYKTDRDTVPETFVPRHQAQMNWYRAALERLTGIPVREMWLVALRAGKAYSVPVLPLVP